MANDQKGVSGSVDTLIATAEAATEAAAEAKANALTAAEGRLSDLDAEREALIATIAALGGETVKPRKARKARKARKGSTRTGTRASNSISLREAVARALTNEPQSPTDIQKAVVAAGYKTDSPNFPQMVAQHLSNLGGTRMGKSPVAINEDRGLWKAGSGMARYLTNPSGAVEV